MKKIIIGCLLIQLLTIEPFIGYAVFHNWLQFDKAPMIVATVIFSCSAIFQLMTYGGLVVDGFKELKITHPFH